jgi:hypothetical protein
VLATALFNENLLTALDSSPGFDLSESLGTWTAGPNTEIALETVGTQTFIAITPT